MATLYDRLLEDPTHFHDAVYSEGFSFSAEQLEAIQLSGIKKRFSELRPQLSMLDKLATEQNINEINSIDDVVPLLFSHTVYKSYPLSYLEKNRFDKLTRWMNGLTTVDLSGLDASGIASIDDWLDFIEEQTGLLISHTSGTTGKLSFVPRSKEQWRQTLTCSARMLRDWWGAGSGPDLLEETRPLIIPGYRYGGSAAQRANNFMIEMFAGSEDNALFMYPNMRFSADVASLGGRLRALESRGEIGAADISPVLLERRQSLLELEKRRPEDIKTFFETAQQKFADKDVYIAGVWTLLYEWARQGQERGLSNIYGKNSILFSGGGKKGVALPDDYREQIKTFLGFDNTYEMYAVSEQMSVNIMCEHGHYHFPPVNIPFLLDPVTGESLPRKDNVTGRMAMLDLMPNSYWAGLITGDEVTWAGWEKPCQCGRTGPYIYDTIRRYSEKEGGDDRVVCAGAPEAHDKALDFLAQLADFG